MSRARLPHSKHEVVAAIGRRTGQRRKVLVLGLYIPPWYNAQQNDSFCTYFNDCLILLKSRYDNPYIVVAGDFNRRDFKKVTRDHPDIKQVVTGPTRVGAVLDIIGSNVPDQLVDQGTTDPLTSDDPDRADADHRVVFASVRMPRVPQYKVEEYSYRRITEEGNVVFREWIEENERKDWSAVMACPDASSKVAALHKIFLEGMNRAYELKTRRKKSSEPAWMADWLRELIRKRRELFKSEGRSDRWKTFKEKITRIITERKDTYNAELREKFANGCDAGKFFTYAQKLMGGNGDERWDVRSLDPSKNDLELAEWLANYFNGISCEYSPLKREEIPDAHMNELPIISEKEVVEKIKKSKKKTSSVPGDLPPNLYTACAEKLARPITEIFNCVIRTKEWPALWGTEHVTIIPKSRNSAHPSECRNISCTNFLSKVLETFVLEWARKEVSPKNNQYGGEKGCGTEHFVVKALDYVTSALEDSRAAVVLSSIDFSKAFNRLEHSSCLSVFKKRGASRDIMELLAAFLMGRTMTVKVGEARSSPRPVNAGAPQGSVLGCFLFNMGIDDLEEDCRYRDVDEADDDRENQGRSGDFPACSTPTRIRPIGPRDTSMSPIREAEWGAGLILTPRVANVPEWLRKPKEGRWTDVAPESLKFVDDSLHMSVVNMKAVRTLLDEQGYQYRTTTAPHAQDMLEHVTRGAEERGMRVNDSKTGLMCVSTAKTYTAKTELRGRDGEVIHGSESLKFLGVTLDSDCSFKSHAKRVAAKLRSRTWVLTKLKRRGMKEDELKKFYTSSIRPVAEYAAAAWHPMLTKEQSNLIEKQQSQALKNILGVGMSARKMRNQLDIPTLDERRQRRTRRFAEKSAASQRFGTWFPTRAGPLYERRQNVNYRTYEETKCRTERHFNSPINYMRRLLNQSDR